MDEAGRMAIKRALELAKKGKIKDALDILYEVAERHSENESVFLLIGEISLSHNDPQRAIRPLEIALELNQENFRTHFLLGNAYGRILRFEDAIEELLVANEIKPNDDEVLRNLGWIHCMAGQTEKGRQYLKTAMKINPHNCLIYNDMAASYMFSTRRDLESAEIWLKKALSIEPNHPFIQQTYQAFKTMKERFVEISS